MMKILIKLVLVYQVEQFVTTAEMILSTSLPDIGDQEVDHNCSVEHEAPSFVIEPVIGKLMELKCGVQPPAILRVRR